MPSQNKTVQNKTQKRLAAPERRQMIIETASRLFAKRGLHGVTTKEIAKACKISEPVLYQHFESKEHIYQELQIMCKGQTLYFHQVLKQVPAGSFGLVLTVFLLCYTVQICRDPTQKGHRHAEITDILLRLQGFSFLEDGRFAKALVKDCIGSVMPYLIESYKVAEKAGEIDGDVSMEEDLWITYELIIGSALFHLTKPGLIPSLSDSDVLLERTVAYILRGLGMKSGVIKKHHRTAHLMKYIGLN